MPLTVYSPRQASLVVSIWIILEIRKFADNQNHSIILLKLTYPNMLQKNEYHFSIFVCVSQASEFMLLESGRQFSKESKILDFKKIVLCRCAGERVKHENQAEFRSKEGLTLETSVFQIFHGGNSTFVNSFDKTRFSKD